jgi:RHS repeat-associated protein
VSTDYVLDGQSAVRTLVNSAADKTWLIGPRGPEYERTGAGAAVWNLYDGLGSVTGTVDSSGNVVSARKYDVYGAVRQLTGPSGTKHKFVGRVGHPSEDETGLVYMRARWMDPVVGRFSSEDPAGDGINWFVYCYNDPINLVDRTGKIVGADDGLALEGTYDAAVGAAYLSILQRLTVIVLGYSVIQVAALVGIFLAKGAKTNTGKNQLENALTNRIAGDLGLTQEESERLHRDLGKSPPEDEEDVWRAARDILSDRNHPR